MDSHKIDYIVFEIDVTHLCIDKGACEKMFIGKPLKVGGSWIIDGLTLRSDDLIVGKIIGVLKFKKGKDRWIVKLRAKLEKGIDLFEAKECSISTK